jgi:hypothetical protein
MKEMHVLGVDLASGRWADNGAAMLSFDAGERSWTGLRVPALKWPACNLTPWFHPARRDHLTYGRPPDVADEEPAPGGKPPSSHPS